MTDNSILWINRIVAVVFYCILIYLCEKYKIQPTWCFIIATFYMIGLTFLFEIIKAVLK